MSSAVQISGLTLWSGRDENLNVASVVVLPVPMLSFSYWELVLIIGNIQQMFRLHENGCGRDRNDQISDVEKLGVLRFCVGGAD